MDVSTYTKASLNFTIKKNIGSEGRNSEVSLAYDHQLDGEIVVKKIAKNTFKEDSKFFEEAKRLYLSAHPNVVPIQYSCYDDDSVYITMPYFKNGSIQGLIQNRNLSIKEIIKFGIDFLSGLHHIHVKGLLHSDIKPTNILINDSNDAILTDFGLAVALDEDGAAEFEKAYSLHRAPETYESNIITIESDVYQAGMTLYRMCVGHEGFQKQLHQLLANGRFSKNLLIQRKKSGAFPERTVFPIHIPKKLKNVIKKALQPNPDDRYHSIIAMLNDLANIEVSNDWMYEDQGTEHVWNCTTDDRLKKVQVSMVDALNAVVSFEKGSSATSMRKVTKHCCDRLAIKDAFTFAETVLHDVQV